MKTILLAGVSLSLLAYTSVASADAPKYGDLPKGTLTSAPDAAKKPAAIGARESVPGFFVAAQKFGPNMPMTARYVTIVGDAKSAAAINAGEGSGDDQSPVCFAEGRESFENADDDESMMGTVNPKHTLAWDENLMYQTNLWPKAKDNPRAGVGAIHTERLVEAKDGTATLEQVDAWVDPATRGARLIGKGSLPMKQIGSAIDGVKIYAAREDKNGKPFVAFVITRPTKQSPMGRGMGLVAMRQDGSAAQSNGCGHIRISLPAEAKGGESAVVAVPLTLPTIKTDGDEHDRMAKKEESERSERTKKGEEEKPKAAEAVVTPPPPPPSKKHLSKKMLRMLSSKPAIPPSTETPFIEPKEKEVRTRDAQISLSVSQTSRDKEPVVAVSFGWSGRETTQRTFDQDEPNVD